MPNKFRKEISPKISLDENDCSYANVKVIVHVEMTANEIKQIVEKASNEAKANINKKAAP